MNYKTMKVPEDVWRSIKMNAAREGVTMIGYLRHKVGNKKQMAEHRASNTDVRVVEVLAVNGKHAMVRRSGCAPYICKAKDIELIEKECKK